MRPIFTSLAFIVLLVNFCLAQSPPFEYGKIKASDMSLADFQAKFPDEPAVIIGDIAVCRFEVNSGTGHMNYLITRTIRYMILSPEGVDYGDFVIPFYQTRKDREQIVGLRGNVFNLVGGRIQSERVRPRDGLVNDVGNNWKEMVVPFPNVKQGSVIELQYTIRSGFLLFLPNWSFQREIPVLHSEFKLLLPSLYIYRVRFRGFEHLAVNQEKPYIETMRIPRPPTAYGISLRDDFLTVNINGMEYLWVAKNLPPLRPEPFTNNIRNYRAAMDFELVTVQYPEVPPRHYSNTWESVREFLFKHEDFGGYLKEAEIAMFHATGIKATDDFLNDMESAIHEIQKRIRWNMKSSLFAEDTPTEVLQRGSGNSAEVNLMLCGLLRNMGYRAETVVLSTVSNGDLFYDTPTISRLNYTIIAVEQNPSEFILLDATEQAWPAGYLPARVLNDKGKFLSDQTTRWIDLASNMPIKSIKTYKLNLSPDGSLSGTMKHEHFSYSKFLTLKGIQENNPNNAVNTLIRTFDLVEEQIEIQNQDNSEAPLTFISTINLKNAAQLIGNEIILSSLIFETPTNQPFVLENRKFPVHFIAPQSEEIIFEIKLPEGFNIAHLPQAQTIRARGGFLYEYQPRVIDNTITIRSFKESSSTMVAPENYNHLRSFNERIIRAHGEKIILISN
jgi:hypothetical protein